MKFQVPLALISLAGVAYANEPHARPEYKKICDSPGTEEVEVQPGLYATYHCGKYTTEGKRTGLNVASPEVCVNECSSSASCVGAIWTAKSSLEYPCYLVDHSSEPALKTSKENMWITYRKESKEDEDPFGDSEEDPFGDSEEGEECSSDLEKCQDLAARTCTNAVQNTVYTVGSKKYKVKCATTVTAVVGSGAGMGTKVDVATFQECAEACAKASGCVRANVITEDDKNTCNLYRNPSSDTRTSDMSRSVLYLV
ncbi:hypothetical protein BDV26DRAFT_283941 [Aspergillus bertholletiae]|uniref:Apple domain-containing protein n=1 Tax=Aspergillus bertholletiae TaxID=1226010 RepID=A0A5N7AYM5_9EURO|nr:hypothetical protein BDV26DRAFT_283941 [Aspergillus bertholletiae]